MTVQTPTGQVALVTGGTRGIGRAVAAFLLDAGIQVVLTGTNRRAAEEVAAQLGAESPSGRPRRTARRATSPTTRASPRSPPSYATAAAASTSW